MDSAHYILKATVTHLSHCAGGISNTGRGHPARADSNPILWRPWVPRSGGQESEAQQPRDTTDNDKCCGGKKGPVGFQHPVRLYMPKSKKEQYLQHMGKTVLASFPVQATIDFYNDDSESEEEEEDEDEMDYCNYFRHYEHLQAKEYGSSREENSTFRSVTEQNSQ